MGALRPPQYAYRRARGADMHLSVLTGFASEHLAANRFVYVASLDVEGAFDTVPHHELIDALMWAGVGRYIVRFLEAWLKGRRFRVRLDGPEGRCVSAPKGITRGLPQGGVISPLLWLLHFNRVFDLVGILVALGGTGPAPEGAYWTLLAYADDLTFGLAHSDAETVTCLATVGGGRVRAALATILSALSVNMCNNLVLSPGAMVGGVARRNNGFSATVNRELATRDRRLGALLDTVNEAALPRGAFPPSLRGRLPYVYRPEFRVLGVIFDERLSFEAHVTDFIGRASVSYGVMAQVARSSWGLEFSVLGSTHSALLTSLVRYALTVVGMSAYEGLLHRMKRRYAKVAARRIAVVSRAARLGILHLVADVLSARNLLKQQCAHLVDRALRAHDSSAQDEIRGLLADQYAQRHWRSEFMEVPVDECLAPRIGERGWEELDVRETWVARLLAQIPQAPSDTAGGGVYYTVCEELREDPSAQVHTFAFVRGEGWMQVGSRVLRATGWRPGCSVAETTPVGRLPPPPLRKRRPLLVGAPSATDWITVKEQHWIHGLDKGLGEMLTVQADSFQVGCVFATARYLRTPEGDVEVQCRITGVFRRRGTPVCFRETALLRALEGVEEYSLRADRPRMQGAQLIGVWAGDTIICGSLRAWK